MSDRAIKVDDNVEGKSDVSHEDLPISAAAEEEAAIQAVADRHGHKKKVKFKEPLRRNDTTESMALSVGAEHGAQPDDNVESFVIRSNASLLSMDTTYSVAGYETVSQKPKSASEIKPELNVSKLKYLKEAQPESDLDVALAATTTKVVSSVKYFDSKFNMFLAKFVILYSRSSGVDKSASFFQYGAMFYGDVFLRYVRMWQEYHENGKLGLMDAFNLCWGQVSALQSNETRWWFLLEDSMSSGRKVLRLFKWMKEIERARLAMTVPNKFLGHARTKTMRILTRVITVVAHCFAGSYYFFDNLVWAHQIGLVNSAVVRRKERELLRFYKSEIKFEEYEQYRNVQRDYIITKQASEKRIEQWKDLRNLASLYRLVLAVINSCLRINSLNVERKRLIKKYEQKLVVSQIVHAGKNKPTTELVEQLRAKIDAMRIQTNENLEDFVNIKSPENLISDRESRLAEVKMLKSDQVDELVAVMCNLLMTLSRLKFRFFKELPLHVIGMLGMTAGWIGIMKNWPKQAPQRK